MADAMGYILPPLRGSHPRVEHTLFFMYALRQDAQHLCSRLLTLECPGFLGVADIKDNFGATPEMRKLCACIWASSPLRYKSLSGIPLHNLEGNWEMDACGN